MSYTHFTAAERAVLEHLHRNGESQREIARQLGRQPSSISRELKRGKPTERCAYRAERAHELAGARRSAANAKRAILRCKKIL